MSKFIIPGDPDKADDLAGELGELVTACEWKRAAIVYARVQVQDGAGRPTENITSDNYLTPSEYAKRGIHGLRSQTTIRAYWRAWHDAIAEGLAELVELGDEVELPDAEWNDYYKIQNRSTPPYYIPDSDGAEVENEPVEGERRSNVVELDFASTKEGRSVDVDWERFNANRANVASQIERSTAGSGQVVELGSPHSCGGRCENCLARRERSISASVSLIDSAVTNLALEFDGQCFELIKDSLTKQHAGSLQCWIDTLKGLLDALKA
jgi:hypothetical protein